MTVTTRTRTSHVRWGATDRRPSKGSQGEGLGPAARVSAGPNLSRVQTAREGLCTKDATREGTQTASQQKVRPVAAATDRWQKAAAAGPFARALTCIRCRAVIRDGLAPESHGICPECFELLTGEPRIGLEILKALFVVTLPAALWGVAALVEGVR